MNEQLIALNEILIEQRRTNALLELLIAALGDEQEDDPQEPSTYLSGKPK